MIKKGSRSPIILNKHIDIGTPDAESDAFYLEECFVDTGLFEQLLDCENPKRIVVGRTGSGKTALLQKIISTQEHAIELAPEALSLSYISNSNIIRFFEAAGVNLSLFYVLLWRHVLTVELLKMRFDIGNKAGVEKLKNFMEGIFKKDPAKEKGLKYLEKWGDEFWEHTEYRVKEFKEKLEAELSVSAGGNIKLFQLGAEGAASLTKEQRTEIVNRANDTVSRIQIKELQEIVSLLKENVFIDSQKPFYIVIDRLDEDWADDELKFKLIKALLETVKSFQTIRTTKVILSLRSDLLTRVLKETVSSGFQEEKYAGLYLNMDWSESQLTEVIDARVNYLFKRKYTRENVKLEDIIKIGGQIQKKSPIGYLIGNAPNF
ncbi:MAG: ATPase [Rhodospirillaceae bacterium]|nr:ATPase [Rhodospirillaceae bacterium]MBT5561061.1 ATPase [Rhodospirillaceae bacterium]MBT6242781.1 ATPase [Rhodospirillaceae bacterium]